MQTTSWTWYVRGHAFVVQVLILYDQVEKVRGEHEQTYKEKRHEKSSKGKVHSHSGLTLLPVC